MRYLSRTNTVRCFSCGWSGDTFSVVGAVYGLTGGEMFRKTYSLLDIDARGGRVAGYSRPVKPAAPQHVPGSAEDLRAIIYPPGWNDPEPEVKLPMPLSVVAEAEIGVSGRLAISPIDIFTCLKCGLRGWHFDDAELGEFFEEVRTTDFIETTTPEFLSWLRVRAAPAHMLRKLSRFIVREDQRRKLEAAFAAAYSCLQNQEPSAMVLEDILNQAELAVGYRFDLPMQDDAALRETVDVLFERFHSGEDVLSLVGPFRHAGDACPHVLN